jgi:hypothetical protein
VRIATHDRYSLDGMRVTINSHSLSFFPSHGGLNVFESSNCQAFTNVIARFLLLPPPVVLGAALDQDFARYQVAADLLPQFGAPVASTLIASIPYAF